MHYLDLVPTLLIPELTKVSMLSANLVNTQGGKWGEARAGLHEKPIIPQDLIEFGIVATVAFIIILPGLFKLNEKNKS